MSMTREAMTRRSARGRSRGLAVVTGASSGIGEAFALELARRRYDLVVVARRRRRLERLARALREEWGARTEVLPADLTRPTGLRAVEGRLETEPRLRLLVNDAGLGDFGPFWKSERAREDAEIRLNVLAVVRLTHAALPGMVRRRRGAVINVSSTAAFAPCPNFATYGATKAFVNCFTEALHEELRGSGVLVQALCPGLTHTEIFDRAKVDTSGLPRFLWMEPDAVVEESLSALERGETVCVPGLGNRALSSLARILPHAASGRIGAVFGSRFVSKP
jgi:short-subunit dehydrogenase